MEASALRTELSSGLVAHACPCKQAAVKDLQEAALWSKLSLCSAHPSKLHRLVSLFSPHLINHFAYEGRWNAGTQAWEIEGQGMKLC
eukprot:scaffold179861_cov14-Tisochrysis_lutea.AAC.1